MSRRKRQVVQGTEPYRSAAQLLLDVAGCTVRRWNVKNRGTAYTQAADWGIAVPEPRGPASFATFAHEVAHQVLHRHNSLPRWAEECEAWLWALAQFDEHRLPGRAVAQADAAKCLCYAASKALQRSNDPAGLWLRIVALYPAWVWAAPGAWGAWAARMHAGYDTEAVAC